jgi:predicted Zn-dependent peptidase
LEFKQATLANGLQLVGEVNPSAKSAAVGFFVKTGARDETAAVSGVSHFLEHMLFKGNERLSALEVNAAFDSTGAQFNAFTSEEATVYYASVLPEYLEEVTKLWVELMHPALRDDDFNLEKNVIKEEIAMYQDMPSFDVMDRCRSLHFSGHPCGNSVLGSQESIDALAAQQMRDYFQTRYAPNNMVLVWAGNFAWAQMQEVAERLCSAWQPQEIHRDLSHFAGSFKSERLVQSALAREHICLMGTGVANQDPRRYAALLLASMVGDDVGSRYYWELVDKALAEAASMQFGPMDGTGTFYSYFRCSPENVPQVLSIVKAILTQLKTEGITEEELSKAKNKILSALVIRNELPMGRLLDLGMNWIYLQQYRPIAEDVAAIKAIHRADVGQLVETLQPDQFTQFSIGPDQDG